MGSRGSSEMRGVCSEFVFFVRAAVGLEFYARKQHSFVQNIL